jgi:preprotein translocase SecE subunit
MTVAVKSEPTVRQDMPSLGRAGASLAGAAYIVLGVIVVYHLLPWFWSEQFAEAIEKQEVSFYQRGLLVVEMLVGAAALFFLWPKIFKPQPGFRAGVAAGVGLSIAGAVLVYVVGLIIGSFQPSETVGIVLAMATAGVWLWLMYRWFHRDRFQERLLEWEEQGWFTAKTYKKGQGLRARRGTVLGIVGIVGCGLWVYTSHKSFFSSPPWVVDVPFNIPHNLVLLWLPSFTLTVVWSAATIWLSYRLVNYPKFADFLIATEAEMSKVTWTSQRHLLRDTVVVLVTVFMMTVFLLAMDFIWSFLLTQLGVLQQ